MAKKPSFEAIFRDIAMVIIFIIWIACLVNSLVKGNEIPTSVSLAISAVIGTLFGAKIIDRVKERHNNKEK